MPGLSLRAGAGMNGTGVMPVPAGQATGPRGGTSTTAAFGMGVGADVGGATAAYGAGIAGTAAALLLLWLWWSLPRLGRRQDFMRPTTRGFIWGLVIAFGGTWAYHAFVKPLPRANTG